MKKQYISPATAIMLIEPTSLMDTSMQKGQGSVGDDDKDTFLGRQTKNYSLWDDDEEE